MTFQTSGTGKRDTAPLGAYTEYRYLGVGTEDEDGGQKFWWEAEDRGKKGGSVLRLVRNLRRDFMPNDEGKKFENASYKWPCAPGLLTQDWIYSFCVDEGEGQ